MSYKFMTLGKSLFSVIKLTILNKIELKRKCFFVNIIYILFWRIIYRYYEKI